ncbi:hypothetical protein [Dactylosporangium sp. NPDC051541]|uniref:hypothetical protein n=1 Tax=Dactylosporangium sp. NPDC051541 TaxID=3363977 RepID=UPI0037B62690
MTDANTHVDPSKPRRGRLRRWVGRVLRNLIGEPPTVITSAPPIVLPVSRTVNRVRTVTFTTPAKGDSYEFTVNVDLCFCATGAAAAERLDAKLDGRLPDLIAEVKAAARPIAREFPPFRPGVAEPRVARAIQQATEAALAGVPDEDGVYLTCSARSRVDMPEEVRQLQRLALAEQVKFESRYEQSEQSAQRLGELREVWSKFIRDGLPSWVTPYALAMAQQPAQVAPLLFKLRDDRKAEAAKLVDAVAAVAAGHERMDLLEFALATDSALSKTYELLGIAAPPDGSDSLFDGDEEVAS